MGWVSEGRITKRAGLLPERSWISGRRITTAPTTTRVPVPWISCSLSASPSHCSLGQQPGL